MRKKLLLSVAALVTIAGIFFCLLYNGVIRFNHPSTKAFPVRGVDVSSYQGKISLRMHIKTMTSG